MYPQEHLVGGLGFPAGSDGKESACNARDPGSVPGSGRSHGERNGYPLSTFAWRIPWTEDPGMLQSMRSRRVGHYWATNNLDSKHGKIVCDYIQIKLSYLLDFVTPLLLFLQFIGTVSPSESDHPLPGKVSLLLIWTIMGSPEWWWACWRQALLYFFLSYRKRFEDLWGMGYSIWGKDC